MAEEYADEMEIVKVDIEANPKPGRTVRRPRHPAADDRQGWCGNRADFRHHLAQPPRRFRRRQ
ncbi:hypothetical protein ACRAWD_22250 [Caulobacter segnis]